MIYKVRLPKLRADTEEEMEKEVSRYLISLWQKLWDMIPSAILMPWSEKDNIKSKKQKDKMRVDKIRVMNYVLQTWMYVCVVVCMIPT